MSDSQEINVAQLMRIAADECMAPEQQSLFDQIGRRDPDVYARLFRCIGERVLSTQGPDGDRTGTTQAAENRERKALLLHLGDVLETISCLTRCGAHHHTVGEAAAQEESLAMFPILRQVDPEMTPAEFVKCASGAFFLWPTQLLADEINRKAIAHMVQHDLFSGNRAGWDAYVCELRHAVPWFGVGLDAYMPDPFANAGDGV
jgi:hypothetical protein